MAPPYGAFKRGSDDEMNLSHCAAAERSADVPAIWAAIAQCSAPLQARVELLENLGVELGGRDCAKGWTDVDPDQILVPLARGVFEVSHFKPLRDRAIQSDGRLWMAVLVDLTLESGPCDFGFVVGLCGLAQVSRSPGEWISPGVHDRTETPRWQMLNVPRGRRVRGGTSWR
jgi:hypothetical protein